MHIAGHVFGTSLAFITHMKRVIALVLLVTGVGYFVVQDFPKDKDRELTETKMDRMMETMEKTEVW